jgi:hypothetical protein
MLPQEIIITTQTKSWAYAGYPRFPAHGESSSEIPCNIGCAPVSVVRHPETASSLLILAPCDSLALSLGKR